MRLPTSPFNSLEEFKAAAEFFPQGRIIPQRILKGPRYAKSQVTFTANTWVMPTPKGYVCACDVDAMFVPADRLASVRSTASTPQSRRLSKGKIAFKGSPYTQGGITSWVSNLDLPKEARVFITLINEALGHSSKG